MTDKSHQFFEELVPWYANGSLDAREMAEFASHLEGCERCRDDVAVTVRQIQTLHKTPVRTVPASPEALLRAVNPPAAGLRTAARWPVALAASLVMALALGVTVAPQPGAFQLLTNSPAPGAVVQVAFAATATEQQVRQFIVDSGGTLLGNPTLGGIYRLQFDAAAKVDVARFEREPVVLWVTRER